MVYGRREVSGGAVANLILVTVLLMNFDFLDHPDRRRLRTRRHCCSSVTRIRRHRTSLGTGTRTTLTGRDKTRTDISSATLFFSTHRKAGSRMAVRGGLTRVAMSAGNKHVTSTALGRCVKRSGAAPIALFDNGSTSVGFLFCGGGRAVRARSCCFATMGHASDAIAVHLSTSDGDCVSFACDVRGSACLVSFAVRTIGVRNGLTTAGGCISVR